MDRRVEPHVDLVVVRQEPLDGHADLLRLAVALLNRLRSVEQSLPYPGPAGLGEHGPLVGQSAGSGVGKVIDPLDEGLGDRPNGVPS